ncbi:MAG: DUF6069 family protein [Actinomycetota bacterium]
MTAITRATPARRLTVSLLVGAGALVALAANSIVAIAAVAAGANAAFPPLMTALYGPFSVVGVVIAYLGWSIIRSRAAHPARVLRVLVPVLSVLSFVPDSVLLATGFIPGASPTAVVALMIMHVVVIGVAVPLSLRLAPLR